MVVVELLLLKQVEEVEVRQLQGQMHQLVQGRVVLVVV
tara:strand:- start:260 stop:373 length:114 start_codon:yes stop_codon:yes gene_type:complete